MRHTFIRSSQWRFRRQVRAETINGRFRAEVNCRRGLSQSLEAVEYATSQCVGWFDNGRLLELINDAPRIEFGQAYYLRPASEAVAA